MLEVKYCIPNDSNQAGKLYGIPYIISACTSPFLGLVVDKVGRRVIFLIFSSIFLLAAYLITMFLPPAI